MDSNENEILNSSNENKRLEEESMYINNKNWDKYRKKKPNILITY